MEKEPVKLDVGCGQDFQLEHCRDTDGVSKYAIVNSRDSSKTIFEKDQPLELTGDGKNTTLRIPGNIGLEADDPPPQIKISTSHGLVNEDAEGITIRGKHAILKNAQKAEAERAQEANAAQVGGAPDKNAVTQSELNTMHANNVAGLPNHVLEQVAEIRRNAPEELKLTMADISEQNLAKPRETPPGFAGEILGPALGGGGRSA